MQHSEAYEEICSRSQSSDQNTDIVTLSSFPVTTSVALESRSQWLCMPGCGRVAPFKKAVGSHGRFWGDVG